jgi:hypothetical protein
MAIENELFRTFDPVGEFAHTYAGGHISRIKADRHVLSGPLPANQAPRRTRFADSRGQQVPDETPSAYDCEAVPRV